MKKSKRQKEFEAAQLRKQLAFIEAGHQEYLRSQAEFRRRTFNKKHLLESGYNEMGYPIDNQE
jgi:hypothetical protein